MVLVPLGQPSSRLQHRPQMGAILNLRESQLYIYYGFKLTLSVIHIRERERNVLFNNILNTFYLRLYGVRHMVKDHSDSEKGNPLPPHRLLLSINSKGSFICTIPDRITHTTAFVTPVVEHWLEREIAQWVHPVKDRSDNPSHHERTLYLWATSLSYLWLE